ncbi:MAG: hypothetical protein MJY62_02360 [Bacteroidales bacterium]|nr:hypothetical protein [Bacteroidales bacterium]
MTPLFIRIIREKIREKWAWKWTSALTPLSSVRQAVVVLDVDSPSYGHCLKAAGDYFASKHIPLTVRNVDFHKYQSGETPLCPEEGTLYRRSINIFGLPCKKYYRPLLSGEPKTVYINLCRRTDFAFRFLNSITPAVLKAGIYPDDNYTINISGEDALSCLTMIFHILDSIR